MRTFVGIAVVLCLAAVAINGQFRFPGNLFGGGNRRPAASGPPRGQFQSGGGGGGCTPVANYQSGGRNFWVSWRTCGTQYRGDQVPGVCSSGGMRPVSLNDPGLAQEFMNLCAREGQKWFWTGGRVSGQSISWPNGVSQNANQLRNLFSHTGGRGVPQPDNREGDEFCLAVLNNFYQDGVKFHDVSCHHTKPTICEA